MIESNVPDCKVESKGVSVFNQISPRIQLCCAESFFGNCEYFVYLSNRLHGMCAWSLESLLPTSHCNRILNAECNCMFDHLGLQGLGWMSPCMLSNHGEETSTSRRRCASTSEETRWLPADDRQVCCRATCIEVVNSLA